MSQEGTEKNQELVQKEWTLKSKAWRLKKYCRRKKGGPFYSSIANSELILAHY